MVYRWCRTSCSRLINDAELAFTVPLDFTEIVRQFLLEWNRCILALHSPRLSLQGNLSKLDVYTILSANGVLEEESYFFYTLLRAFLHPVHTDDLNPFLVYAAYKIVNIHVSAPFPRDDPEKWETWMTWAPFVDAGRMCHEYNWRNAASVSTGVRRTVSTDQTGTYAGADEAATMRSRRNHTKSEGLELEPRTVDEVRFN